MRIIKVAGRTNQNNGDSGPSQVRFNTEAKAKLQKAGVPLQGLKNRVTGAVGNITVSAAGKNAHPGEVIKISAGVPLKKGLAIVRFIESTNGWSFDVKRATKRRLLRAKRKAAKRKTYGWGEFQRTEGRANSNAGGERGQAKDRKSQRKLERWVMSVGAWKSELGFDKTIHYIKNVTKAGGMDFEVRTLVGDTLVGRIDAKSEFKTTPAQDRQIAQSWKDGIPCFLVSRTKYLRLTPRTKRKANGSIWG